MCSGRNSLHMCVRIDVALLEGVSSLVVMGDLIPLSGCCLGGVPQVLIEQ